MSTKIARTKQQDVHVRKSTRILHVETELGIVNIHIGLHDDDGHDVESVELLPDDYSGEPQVRVDGHARARFVRETPDEKLARERKTYHAANP